MGWQILVDLLMGHKVFLQTHNFPDPDALASAYGMQVFLQAHGVKSTNAMPERLISQVLRRCLKYSILKRFI